MKNENESKHTMSNYLSVICELLQKNGLIAENERDLLTVTALAGDGSSRKFWRITKENESLCLAVAPPCLDAQNIAEAKAARAIGQHLVSKNIPVPKQYGWDADSAILLFEDFGDCKLHDFVLQNEKETGDTDAVHHLYTQVIEALVVMQVAGAESFNTAWCWDTPQYDKSLMLERESGYFVRAFWQDLLGHNMPSGLDVEFQQLATLTASIPADYFLHRDFQSRNIMISTEIPRFIDFQGGRLGPLAYDMASLLIDPYVMLSVEFQEEMFDLYQNALESFTQNTQGDLKRDYTLLALHRNLQIVGAFSFLSEQRGKLFFRQFLTPALNSLARIVADPFFVDYPVLRKCVQVARQEFLK
jgi:aminoglycoside/choline kinase family phosphotransferase